MGSDDTAVAVALELRAQAEKLAETSAALPDEPRRAAMRFAMSQLRDRADELDPPRAPTFAEAIQTGIDAGIASRTRPCPVNGCGVEVLVCDNGVWLEPASAKTGGMALMAPQQVGPMLLAMGMGRADENTHDLHIHQPGQS